MDYEKKYKEALEQAKKELAQSGPDSDSARQIKRFFPELSESEDERIRKWIIEEFKIHYDFESPSLNPMVEKALAWLKKQKDIIQAKVEQRMEYLWDKLPDAHRVEEGNCTPEEWKALGAYMELEMNFDKGSEEEQKEQKSKDDEQKGLDGIKRDWFERGKKEVLTVPELYGLEKQKEQLKIEYIPEDRVFQILSHLEFLRTSERIPVDSHEYNELCEISQLVHQYLDYPIKQKPAEWSEDNIKELTEFEAAMLHIGMSFFGGSAGLNPNNTNEVKKQAKLLLELVPKQEWSEEDEATLTEIINSVNGFDAVIGNILQSFEQHEKKINWLKSLRPQPRKEIYQAAKHDLALRFMNYLDENRPEGKMSLSNGECEDIDKAFKKNDWAKIMRYIEKYNPHWKPSEHQMTILKAVKDYVGKGSGYWGEALGSLIEDLEKLM